MFVLNHNHDADVVRRDAIPIVDNRFGKGYGPVFLNNLNCEGEENNILNCQNPLLVHFCTHEDDVGIVCPGWLYI